MTNPTDLRIGNWIQDVGEGELFQVDKISKDRITAGAMTIYLAGFEFDHYVPLTEEWLLKFSFDSKSEVGNGNFNYWNKEKDCSIDVEPNLTDSKIEILFYYRVHEHYRKKPLIYVHQLQNLYFALTGLELTIKE